MDVIRFKFLVSISLTIAFYSCVQDFNSSSRDREQYQAVNIDTSTPAGLRLYNAYIAIKNNCVSCHSQMNLTSDTDWINSGYVTPGSSTSSLLYCRIKASGCGAEDMPQNSNISNTELTAIRTWIDNL